MMHPYNISVHWKLGSNLVTEFTFTKKMEVKFNQLELLNA